MCLGKNIVELSSKSYLENDNLNAPHCNFDDLLSCSDGLIFLSVFGLVLSVVGAFYYIRIVKLMYFDEPKTIVKKSFSKGLSFTNTICLIFIISLSLSIFNFSIRF